MVYKFLLASLLLGASPSYDGDGWVAVDRPEKGGEAFEEVDPSIWVVFAKQMGPEKLLISFPEDPAYHYMDKNGEEMEIVASSPDVEYRLQILKKTFSAGEELLAYRMESLQGASIARTSMGPETEVSAELTYWKEGYWYMERLLSTEYHTYFFQTKSGGLDDDAHRIFISSFDLYRA